MTPETLERFLSEYLPVAGSTPTFGWQGGEPTLMGLSFFQKIVNLQTKYCRARQRIENDLQTNGTLLNAEWAAFLKKHGFLVGLSIDGPLTISSAADLLASGTNDLSLNGTMQTTAGSILLRASRDVLFNASSLLTSTTGPVTVNAAALGGGSPSSGAIAGGRSHTRPSGAGFNQ